uniref:Uncharacterized protein n=1 Tax=Prorocentrum micans TaxID=2945 RepID=A0A7S2TCT3_PROMC
MTVSQSASFSFLPRTCMNLVLKSTPMVDAWFSLNSSSQKRRRIEDLPTPESPMIKSLNKNSCDVSMATRRDCADTLGRYFSQNGYSLEPKWLRTPRYVTA